MIYRTEYMNQLHSFKDNKLIKVVTGLRRSGKSTLLQMFRDELIKDGVAENQIQYINFELMKYLSTPLRLNLMQTYMSRVPTHTYYLPNSPH